MGETIEIHSMMQQIQTIEIHSVMQQIQTLTKKIVSVSQWISTHCDIQGNERADILAKKGTRIGQKGLH